MGHLHIGVGLADIKWEARRTVRTFGADGLERGMGVDCGHGAEGLNLIR